MADLGEHIEAMIGLFKENGSPLVVSDIAENVAEIAFAQGLVDTVAGTPEDDALLAQIGDQVRYMLRPGEEVVR